MELAYREYGSGQALIILHGLFGQSDNWNTLAKKFAEAGFHVFTPDLRNHGLSGHKSEWSYEVMAEDMNEFILLHNLSQPILLGHSMGGKVVMFYEALYPEKCKKLIVVDIAPRIYKPHHQLVLEALNAVDFTKLNTRKEAEALLGNYIEDVGTKQFLLKNIYWKEDKTKQMDWRFNLKAITDNYDNIGIEAPVFSCKTPTLFIKGDRSDYITAVDEHEIVKRFTNYKIETIVNSGHWVHAEQPLAFYNTVINFIRE